MGQLLTRVRTVFMHRAERGSGGGGAECGEPRPPLP